MPKRPKEKPEKVSVSVWFDPHDLEQLDRLAARDDRPRSHWIRMATMAAVKAGAITGQGGKS